MLAGEAFGQKPRELARWQVVVIGGLAGALASILTTPADVLKTRIMTAPSSQAATAGECSTPGAAVAVQHSAVWLRLICISTTHTRRCTCQTMSSLQLTAVRAVLVQGSFSLQTRT